MSAPVVVYCPSNDTYDHDLYFVAPAGMTEAEAEAKTREVHKSFHAVSHDEGEERDEFIAAMAAAGLIYPAFASGPTWDIASGKRPK